MKKYCKYCKAEITEKDKIPKTTVAICPVCKIPLSVNTDLVKQ